MQRFAKEMRKNASFCVMIDGRTEDQEISDCFRKLNIYPGESRDELNRERFLMDTFEQLWAKPSKEQLDYFFNPVRTVCTL